VASPIVTRPAIDGRMIPATREESGVTVLPITLPDGRHYELVYPSRVDVAALGVQLYWAVRWPVSKNAIGYTTCCDREVVLTYSTVAALYPNAAPVATYPGADANVVYLFHSTQRRSLRTPDDTGDYLVYQFGAWVAEISAAVGGPYLVALDEDQRRTYARSLHGSVDAGGFVQLQPQAPLSADDPKTVQVVFGKLMTGATFVDLSQFYCGQAESDTDKRRFVAFAGETTVSWCDPVTGFHVSATGPDEFAQTIATALILR
jgi:hypothetical protein